MQYGFLFATIEIFAVVTFLLIKFSPRKSELAFSDHISQGFNHYLYLCGGLLYLILSLGTYLDSSITTVIKLIWFLLSLAYLGVITLPRHGRFVLTHDTAARMTGALLFLLSVVMLLTNYYSATVRVTCILLLGVLSVIAYLIEIKRTQKTKYLYLQSVYFYVVHIILLILVYFR